MAKVVVRVISDTQEIELESVIAAGIATEEAQRIASEITNLAHAWERVSATGFVTEFHYQDGDVGAYDDIDARALWTHFTNRHTPSHILIRHDTEQGQVLSNQLHAATKMHYR